MRLCHFDDIQNKTQWYTILLEVDCKGHECFMVRGSPRVGCEIQVTFIFLESGESFSGLGNLLLTRNMLAILWRVHAKTIRTSWVTVDGNGR
jgi:hypothetical protein